MVKKVSGVLVLFILFSFACRADTSGSVSLVSDYLFNGVSQTDEKPALQIGLSYADDSGWYIGTWGSNVDFADGSNAEVDVFAGYAGELSNGVSYDISLLYYAYFGASSSSDGNYPELAASLTFKNTTLGAWYSWDYFGTDADHYIIALNHAYSLNEDWTINVGVDMSTSMDEELYTWEANDDNYIHWFISADTQWRGFDLSLGIHSTDLDTYGDTTVLGTVSRSFSF